MSSASMESRALFKTYRLKEAIAVLNKEVKTNPERKTALEAMKSLLQYWQQFVPTSR